MDFPTINRAELKSAVESSIREWPVTLVLGPRQCGKSHLAKLLGAPAAQFFDLEDMVDEARLRLNPQAVLAEMRGIVVIDEAQRMPELMPILRVLADRPGNPVRFVLTGSVAPPLRKTAGESLAGRINTIDMAGFGIEELGAERAMQLWLRGGLPPSYLADTDAVSLRWRRQYLRHVLEGDLVQLVDTKLDALQLQRMALGMAHYNGQVWNESELAKIVGTTPRTIGRYLDLFWRLFHVRLLPPFFVNVAKRLRKAPKLYFRDSGLAHAFLGIDTLANLQAHPRMGGSWEAFVIEHIIRLLGVNESACSHYGVHSGAELDLVIQTPAGLLGFEIKFGPPAFTASMRSVLADLKPAKIYSVYYGDRDYPLGGSGEPVRAVGITSLTQLAQQLRREFQLEGL